MNIWILSCHKKKIFKCEIKSAIVGLYVKKIDAVGKKNITEREKRDQRVWYSLKIVKKICPNPSKYIASV